MKYKTFLPAKVAAACPQTVCPGKREASLETFPLNWLQIVSVFCDEKSPPTTPSPRSETLSNPLESKIIPRGET